MEKIIAWSLEKAPPLLCFQEVFTERSRRILKERLERNGYTVVLPRDEGVTLFPSGLVTAIRTDSFIILESSFRPYLAYHNVEIFANKGFHRVHLQDRYSQQRIHIINTHTQSDEEVLTWTPYSYKKRIRYQQAEQILEECKEFRDPMLVLGDLNQETSLHPHLRTLHPLSTYPLKKATFFRTGEDLDHVAWMPLQWSQAIGGCGFCGKHGPALEFCKVHPVTWSDHAPVEVLVRIPMLMGVLTATSNPTR